MWNVLFVIFYFQCNLLVWLVYISSAESDSACPDLLYKQYSNSCSLVTYTCVEVSLNAAYTDHLGHWCF